MSAYTPFPLASAAHPQRPYRATRGVIRQTFLALDPTTALYAAQRIIAWDAYQARLRQRRYLAARPDGRELSHAAD